MSAFSDASRTRRAAPSTAETRRASVSFPVLRGLVRLVGALSSTAAQVAEQIGAANPPDAEDYQNSCWNVEPHGRLLPPRRPRYAAIARERRADASMSRGHRGSVPHHRQSGS